MLFRRRSTTKKATAVIIALLMALSGSVMMPGASYAVNDAVDDPNYADNQLIVTFKDDVSKTSAADIVAFAVSEELIQENGSSTSISNIKDEITLTKVKSDQNMMLAQFNVNLDEEVTAREMQKNPEVVAAQPNYYYVTGYVGDGMTYDDSQWHLDYIDAPQAWSLIERLTKNGKLDSKKKVTVAMLDCGVSSEHEELQKSMEASINTSNNENPRSGHGTSMAGIIGASAGNDDGVTGVAGGQGNNIVKLMSIDVFHDDTRTTNVSAATTADIIAGLDYACSHNAQIVTMGFGRHGYDKALEDKINWTAEEGVLMIAAAGDDGEAGKWYPASYENCISCINTVKYTDAFSAECKSDSSSYGDENAIAAPGTAIKTTDLNNQYTTVSGSSYSAAVVAGTAAMVMFVDPTLTPNKVKDILYKTTTDLGISGKDVFTGWGNVNAYRAVAKAAKVKVKESGSLDTPVAKVTVDEGTLVVSWKEVADADGYIVSRKAAGEEAYSQVAELPKDELAWSDGGCKTGTKYSYIVLAKSTTEDGKKLSSKNSKAVTGVIK